VFKQQTLAYRIFYIASVFKMHYFFVYFTESAFTESSAAESTTTLSESLVAALPLDELPQDAKEIATIATIANTKCFIFNKF
jgi:hypothetical protein